jgi:hypothetical protein
MNPEQQAAQATATALAVITDERAALDGWTIDNTDDQALAADMLRDVKRRHKSLDTKRKTITTPLLEAKRAVDDLFRAPRELLEEVEGILKEKIAAFLDRAATANSAALLTASKAESLDEAAAALATIEHVEAPAGVSVRHVWRAIVFNEELLDRRFLSPDQRKIDAWAKEHVDADGKPFVIAGVNFEREAIVSSREVKQAKIERIEVEVKL